MHLRTLAAPAVTCLALALLVGCAAARATSQPDPGGSGQSPSPTAPSMSAQDQAVQVLFTSIGAQDWGSGREVLQQAASEMSAPAEVPPAVLDEARSELTTWLYATSLDPEVITAPAKADALRALLMQDAFPPYAREEMTKMWSSPLYGKLPAGMADDTMMIVTSALGQDVKLVGSPRVHTSVSVHVFDDTYDDDAHTPFRAASFTLGGTFAYPVSVNGAPPTLLLLQRTTMVEADLAHVSDHPLAWAATDQPITWANQSCDGQHQGRWVPDTTITSAQLQQSAQRLLRSEAQRAAFAGPVGKATVDGVPFPDC